MQIPTIFENKNLKKILIKTQTLTVHIRVSCIENKRFLLIIISDYIHILNNSNNSFLIDFK